MSAVISSDLQLVLTLTAKGFDVFAACPMSASISSAFTFEMPFGVSEYSLECLTITFFTSLRSLIGFSGG
jgi:hypothetical protein